MIAMSDRQRKAMFAGISLRQRAEMKPGIIKDPTEPATILGMYRPSLRGRYSRRQFPYFSLEEWKDLPSIDLPSLERVKRYLQWLDMQQRYKEFHGGTVKPLLAALKDRPLEQKKELREAILELEKIPMAVPEMFRHKFIERKNSNIDIDQQGNLILTGGLESGRSDIPESSVMPYSGEPVIRKKYVPELVEKLERTGKLGKLPIDIERLKRVR